jgi:hypothetical protein
MIHAPSYESMDARREEKSNQAGAPEGLGQTTEFEIVDRVARLARRGWFQRILEWFYGYDKQRIQQIPRAGRFR